MEELLNVVEKLSQWGITPNHLGAYFVLLSDTQKEYIGYGPSEIHNILKIREEDVDNQRRGKIVHLKRLISKTFKYNFEDNSVEEKDKDYYKYIIKKINSLSRTLSRKKITPFTIDVDLKIAEKFEGLYLGVTKSDNDNNIPSFLMKIYDTGDIEIASHNKNYRTGVMTIIDYRIYFFLNNHNNTIPELYSTSISFEKKMDNDSKVEKFVMCGMWTNKIGKPAYGSCLLINQIYNKFNPDSLVLRELKKTGVTLNGLNEEYFQNLENSAEFLSAVEELKNYKNVGVHHLEEDNIKLFD